MSGPASGGARLLRLHQQLTACRKCPRLVAWREQVAAEKRAMYRGQEYWGRPVPGFGDPEAAVLVLGLAPGAHGANRTGRMFTGDRSGDWLYRAMHRAGLASRPESVGRDDGLELRGAFVTAPVRCAPPGNRPNPAERDACRPWLEAELDLLPDIAVVVCLGRFAYEQALAVMGTRDVPIPRPRPAFSHGGEVPLDGGPVLLLSYHPSQQNTFTGRLTEEMLDRVFARAVLLASR